MIQFLCKFALSAGALAKAGPSYRSFSTDTIVMVDTEGSGIMFIVLNALAYPINFNSIIY
jgi:hypothetical protein